MKMSMSVVNKSLTVKNVVVIQDVVAKPRSTLHIAELPRCSMMCGHVQ